MAQPTSTSATLYQSHPSSTTAGYPSFSSYGHHRLGRQPQSSATVTVSGGGGAVATASGSRGALKRTGIASSHGSLTGTYYVIVAYDNSILYYKKNIKFCSTFQLL